jgi:transposase-like protein
MSEIKRASEPVKGPDPRGSNPASNDPYPPAFRDRVLREVEAGSDRLIDVARRNGISTALVQKWVWKHRPDLAGPDRIRRALGMARPQFSGTSLEDDKLTSILFALAHPVRREIVAMAANGPLRQADLQGRFDMSPPMLSNHFGKLVLSGLLSYSGNGRNRFWTLNQELLQGAIGALEGLIRPSDESVSPISETSTTKHSEPADGP